jgi:hypothetical protein
VSFVTFEIHRQAASLIFSPVDAFALEGGLRGPRPRPIGPLKYVLMRRTDGGDPKNLFRPLEVYVVHNNSGFDLFFDVARLATNLDDPPALEPYQPGRGRLRKFPIAAGKYELRIISLFYAPFTVEVTYPDPRLNPDPRSVPPPTPSPDIDPFLLLLRPGPLYPFPPGTTTLRGVVQDTSGAGVAGAVVKATGLNNQSYQTDASGQWVLVFPDPPAITKPPPTKVDTTVTVTRPDGSTDVFPLTVTYGAANVVSQTALRGWVQARNVGVIGASVRAGALAVTTGAGGAFAIVFRPTQIVKQVDVSATLADGRSQTELAIPIVLGSTLIVPTFRFA